MSANSGSSTTPGLAPSAERALVEQVRRGFCSEATAAEVDAGRHAADALFAASQDRLYWLCLRLVGRPEVAAELAQEAMLIGYERLPEFRGESSFHTWLHAVARHVCMRANERRRELLGIDDLFEPEDPARGALAALRREERDRLLAEARQAALDPDEQEAVILRYELGVGEEEVAALLHLTNASGARGLLQRCRRKLRRELERRLAELGHGTSLVFGSVGSEE